jgi:hypothetical protein
MDGSGGGGIFTVREGDAFPEFRVIAVDGRGITISVNGRGYFYPVGGVAIGSRAPAVPAQTAAPTRQEAAQGGPQPEGQRRR